MSDFFSRDDSEFEAVISSQPLETAMLVSPMIQDESKPLFTTEQIVNGYDPKRILPEKSGRGCWLFSAILLAGTISWSVFFLGRMILGVPSTEKPPSVRITFLSQQFPGLERTLSSHNPEIISVLGLLAREGDTPEKYLDRSNLPSHAIVNAMKKNFRAVHWDQELEPLRMGINREPWGIHFQNLKQNADFFSSYQKAILDLRQKIRHPDPLFAPEFELTRYGFHLKPSVVENLWGYVHMEEYEIAGALLGMHWNDIKQASHPYPGLAASMDRAVESLSHILEIAYLASLEKDLVLRLHTSYIREIAFDILQQLVNSPDFRQTHAQRLFYQMSGQIKLWPSDVLGLEGERLGSFYLYEMARKGDFFSLLSLEDKIALQSVGDQQGLDAWHSKEMIDQDQIYYLQMVQEIMDCSSEGEDYFEQKPVLDRIEQDLIAKHRDGKQCIIADFLLLRGIRKIKKSLAVDKERVSEMVIALGSTLRLPIPPEAMTDPVSGKPFLVKEFKAFESDWPIPVVTVSNTDGSLSLTVPTKLAVVAQP